MKLEKKHQAKLEEILSTYREVHETMETKKNEMAKLQKDIHLLIKKLESNRRKEIGFGQELEKHYGKGTFNIKTGEYELVS